MRLWSKPEVDLESPQGHCAQILLGLNPEAAFFGGNPPNLTVLPIWLRLDRMKQTKIRIDQACSGRTIEVGSRDRD